MIEKLEHWSSGIEVGGGLIRWERRPNLDDVIDKVNELIEKINELERIVNESKIKE